MMIRQVIENIQEETKVSGHAIEVTEKQVMAFLTNKFGKIDELSSYTVIGNMIKMLFIANSNASSYTTEIEWVQKNVDYDGNL